MICWFIFVWIIGLTVTSLFILGALTGLIFSPIFPLSFALINQQLNVIPILLALLLAGSAIGSIVFQKIAGKIKLSSSMENTSSEASLFPFQVSSWTRIRTISPHY